MTEPLITRERFTAAMERAVALKGEDYVYEMPGGGDTCLYRYEDKPSCIIGHVLEDLGVPYSPDWERTTSNYVLKTMLGIEDETLCSASVYAQGEQDNGGTWGQALSDYKERLSREENN